ncbi:CPBP family intramembrane glutamic endopeptidase [Oceanobacillus manasiensis]|uniref:CPBP family intramembrane glutamic endopeptidase n=1 Tax=Oceanobacillus manasiensis TaxID=586413 RepID=UPI0005A714C5|nr:type II CAAX endopeptidase family protein [Oceanobacillus manasiensis]
MPKRYWWVIISYLIMQFSVFLMAPLLYRLLPISIEQASIYWSITSFILGMIVVILLLRPDMKMTRSHEASPVGVAVAWSIIGVFMAYAAQFIAALLEMGIFGIQPGSENTQGIMDIARATPLFILIPAIIAPVLEEIIFRKIIFGELYKRTNFFIAALISAFIFGIIHGEPQHIIVYGSMGLVFAFLYVKTKRILVPIFVHAAMNTIVVLVQYNLTPEDIERMQKNLQDMQAIIFG